MSSLILYFINIVGSGYPHRHGRRSEHRSVHGSAVVHGEEHHYRHTESQRMVPGLYTFVKKSMVNITLYIYLKINTFHFKKKQ